MLFKDLQAKNCCFYKHSFFKHNASTRPHPFSSPARKRLGKKLSASWGTWQACCCAETSTSRAFTSQVTALNMNKLLTVDPAAHRGIVAATISIKFCHSLGRELTALSLQAPALESLSLAATDPDDERWLSSQQEQCLNLANECLRFPSLLFLSVTALPQPKLKFSSSSMPRLR